jgi:hypothetical protein
MAAGTSFVHTPVHEEDEGKDEIGMTQLGGAPFPSQFEEQVLETTFHYIRDKLEDCN